MNSNIIELLFGTLVCIISSEFRENIVLDHSNWKIFLHEVNFPGFLFYLVFQVNLERYHCCFLYR